MNKSNIIKLTVGLLLMSLQSCLEYPADLRVTIQNNTQSDILVDEYTCCDFNQIEQNAGWFCQNTFDAKSYPRIVKKREQGIMNTRMKASESIMAINTDSIKAYCKNIQKIRSKPWAKVITRDVDKEKKLCEIQIN